MFDGNSSLYYFMPCSVALKVAEGCKDSQWEMVMMKLKGCKLNILITCHDEYSIMKGNNYFFTHCVQNFNIGMYSHVCTHN